MMGTIRPEKILKIIETQMFTVKQDNRELMNLCKQMMKENKIELKDTYKDCYYFGKPDGKKWSLKNGHSRDYGDGPHAGAYWTDNYW